MKIYIIEILDTNEGEWIFFDRVAYKNKKEAEKVVDRIKNHSVIISTLKLK